MVVSVKQSLSGKETARIPYQYNCAALSRCCGLGDDAVLFWAPLHASPGEAGEVRRSPAVLCHRPAHRNKKTGRKFCLQVTQWLFVTSF